MMTYLGGLTRRRLFWPAALLGLLLLRNLIFKPTFFRIEIRNGDARCRQRQTETGDAEQSPCKAMPAVA